MTDNNIVNEIMQELIFSFFNYMMLLQLKPEYQINHSLLVDDMASEFNSMMNDFKEMEKCIL